MKKKLQELQEERAAKQVKVQKVFAEAGAEIDLEKVKEISGTADEKREWLKRTNTELDDLTKKIESLEADIAAADKLKADTDRMIKEREDADKGDTDPERFPRQKREGEEQDTRSIGELIMDTNLIKNKAFGTEEIGDEDLDLLPQLKADFLTTAGWAPRSPRIGRIAEMPTFPLTIVDLVPSGPTRADTIIFMEETTRTQAAAERTEVAAYAESSFALTERSVPVRMIGHMVPVSDIQLEDVPGARSYLDNRMGRGVMERLDAQLMAGDGEGAEIGGFNTLITQAQAKVAEEAVPDTLLKAAQKVRFTGGANPNFVLFHPNDYTNVRLTKDKNDNYILGPPNQPGPEVLWGLRVAQSNNSVDKTALVGDAGHSQVFVKKRLIVEIGWNGTDFSHGKRTIRAGMRACLVIFRKLAFCKATALRA